MSSLLDMDLQSCHNYYIHACVYYHALILMLMGTAVHIIKPGMCLAS